MMELQWGGCGGSGTFRYFSRWKMAGGLLVCKWLVQQATINRRAAACGKGVGYTFPPAEAVSLQH